MSASASGHRAAERGEIALQTLAGSSKSPASEMNTSTHAAAGVVQTFLRPRKIGHPIRHRTRAVCCSRNARGLLYVD